MASFSTSRYFIILCFFNFCFKPLTADSNSSFSLKNFGQDSNFDSFLDLYGDARVVNGGSSVQITAPFSSSAGRVIYKRPIKIYGGIPKKLVSFSTYLTFSMWSNSRNGGGGLAFVVLPSGYPVDLFDVNGSYGMLGGKDFKFLSVEFDAFGNDTSSFVYVKTGNLSSVNLGLNNHGERLQIWIDYESGSRRLEVRLSRIGRKRPLDPLLFEQVDLSKIWPKHEIFFVGLSSSNGNSSKSYNVYSWSFNARQAPDWMHSQPLDPTVLKKKNEDENTIKVPKESDCVIKILAALILGIGCGALGSFVVMFLWTVLGNRRPVMPEELSVKSMGEFGHEKSNVALEKASTTTP